MCCRRTRSHTSFCVDGLRIANPPPVAATTSEVMCDFAVIGNFMVPCFQNEECRGGIRCGRHFHAMNTHTNTCIQRYEIRRANYTLIRRYSSHIRTITRTHRKRIDVTQTADGTCRPTSSTVQHSYFPIRYPGPREIRGNPY